jgi:type VI secretion system protein ImpM
MPKSTLTPPAIAGWFGKIPNLGDFASRRLPDNFVQRWDRWLQSSLAHARDDLGESWQGTYLVAPILRFWLGPGALGDNAWAGLLMPSIDRVGRHFPLTVAQACGSLAEALAAGAWFTALDGAARRVLDFAFTVDDLERELLAVSKVEGGMIDRPAEALAADLLDRCAAPMVCSVWWCGAAGEGTEFRCFDGLPPPAEFSAMLGVMT